MTLGRLRLSVADARDLAEGALRGIGYRNDEARIIAEHVEDLGQTRILIAAHGGINHVVSNDARLTVMISDTA